MVKIRAAAERPSLLADALEAIIGAIFLEHGYQKAASWVVELLSGEIRRASQAMVLTQKQAAGGDPAYLQEAPSYEVLSEHGPGSRQIFSGGSEACRQKLGTGEGFSKKKRNRQQHARPSAIWACWNSFPLRV